MARTCLGSRRKAALVALSTLWPACALGPAPALADPASTSAEPPLDQASSAAPLATAERIQILYDARSGEVHRRLVRVVDPHPEQKLDFTWEPSLPALAQSAPETDDTTTNAPSMDPPLGLDADGYASGQGTLTWRIPGTAAYDPRAFHSRYSGRLIRGAPHGHGTMLFRDGSRLDGTWQQGVLNGSGRWLQADGSLYTGAFEDSLPHGIGLLRSAAGWSYAGSFERGQPHGLGQITSPGQAPRAAQMRQGVELPSTESAALMQAQASGDAARVEIGVVTNGRVSLMQDYTYVHHNDGERLHLLPQPMPLGDEGELARLWEGGGPQPSATYYEYFSPSVARDMRAYLDVTIRTLDGSRVRLDGLDLVIDVSAPHLRPLLAGRAPVGCTGFRPWLDIVNYGWGPVEAPRARITFGALDYGAPEAEFQPRTDWVDLPAAGFDAGATFDFTQALQKLGVDTASFANNRFSCPSADLLDTCARNVTAYVPLGQIQGLVQLHDRSLRVPAQLELSYSWTDAWGAESQLVESFSTEVALAHLELPVLEAEMGDGGAFATPAPDYLEVTLPTSGSELFLPIPLRGNPNITSITAHVQLAAEQSSFHALRFEARLGDGSVQSSMPVWFYALIPRDADYITTARPGACYLASQF